MITFKNSGLISWILLETITIKSRFDHFCKQYQTKDVIPYIHALHAHVSEILKLYKNIAYYTQQGMQKYNDRASKKKKEKYNDRASNN